MDKKHLITIECDNPLDAYIILTFAEMINTEDATSLPMELAPAILSSIHKSLDSDDDVGTDKIEDVQHASQLAMQIHQKLNELAHTLSRRLRR